MRFDKLIYLHTDEFEDVKEIKLAGNFKNDINDVLTVELWDQENSTNVVIIDNMTNEIIDVTDEEEKFVLKYAKENKFI